MCYSPFQVFGELFDKVIAAIHGHNPEDEQINDMDPTKVSRLLSLHQVTS